MVLADRDQSASLEESCAVPLLCRLALATACDDRVLYSPVLRPAQDRLD
jgi:hypothetical protein